MVTYIVQATCIKTYFLLIMDTIDKILLQYCRHLTANFREACNEQVPTDDTSILGLLNSRSSRYERGVVTTYKVDAIRAPFKRES